MNNYQFSNYTFTSTPTIPYFPYFPYFPYTTNKQTDINKQNQYK